MVALGFRSFLETHAECRWIYFTSAITIGTGHPWHQKNLNVSIFYRCKLNFLHVRPCFNILLMAVDWYTMQLMICSLLHDFEGFAYVSAINCNRGWSSRLYTYSSGWYDFIFTHWSPKKHWWLGIQTNFWGWIMTIVGPTSTTKIVV